MFPQALYVTPIGWMHLLLFGVLLARKMGYVPDL
jgi:hypothetical protein